MGGLRVGGLAAAILALALPGSAIAGTPVLYPSGSGEHSYSAWKGDEGLPDSTGNKDEALYFQKETSTASDAAAVALFKGFEGMDTSQLGDLAFWYRADGHCGPLAPRYELVVQPPSTSDPEDRQTFNFACNGGMVPGPPVGLIHEDRLFFERHTVGLLPPGTVVSLSIVFDQGNELLTPFVHLDDIRVGDHLWTSASDNAEE
jgi:hypothetical protein